MRLKILITIKSAPNYFFFWKKKADFCSNLALILYDQIESNDISQGMPVNRRIHITKSNIHCFDLLFYFFAVAL